MKEILGLVFVVLIFAAIIFGFMAGVIKIRPIESDQCKLECGRGLSGRYDWTCIKDCRELNK